MAEKIEQNQGYGSTESKGQQAAAANSTPPPAEETPQEKKEKKPEITEAKWVFFENEKEGYEKIEDAKPGAKIKVRLRIKDSNLANGKNIDIKILDEGDKEVGTTKLTVDGKGFYFYSEDVEIDKEWILKELHVKIEEGGDFEIDKSVGKRVLHILPFEFAELFVQVFDARTQSPVPHARVKRLVFDNGDKQITEEFDRNEKGKRHSYSNMVELIKCSMAALGSFTTGGTSTTDGNRKNTTKFENLPTEYDKTFLDLFKDYWEERAPDFKIEMNAGEEAKYKLLLQRIVMHYNSHLVSNQDGFLTLFIPKPFLDDKKVSIEIGFFDFPVVLESITGTEGVTRPSTTTKENKTSIDYAAVSMFNIAWKSPTTQETDYGKPFGWEIQNGEERSELKVSEKIVIKDDTEKFEDFDPNLLSPFYKEHKFHFALFVMQWCQPVWDGIEDPVPENGIRSNNDAFVNRRDAQGNWIRGLNMHIVTKHDAGGYDDFGHYYGFFDSEGNTHRYSTDKNSDGTLKYSNYNKPHQGVDFYSGASGNDSIFAIHGGRLECSVGDGYGNRAFIRLIENANNPSVQYAHLSTLPSNKYVMAGERFGSCGRTGYNNAPSHLHFELLNSQGTKVEFDKLSVRTTYPTTLTFEIPLRENAFLYQGNKLPLMLPCRCHNPGTTTANCGFGNNNNTEYKTCWAVREFPYTDRLLNHSSHSNADQHSSDFPIANTELVKFICPNILNSSNLRSKLQAKLRFMIENQGLGGLPESTHLNAYSMRNNVANGQSTNNGIDGDIGPTTKNWVKALIKTYQDSLGDNDANKTINIDSQGATMPDYAQLFINRVCGSTQVLSNNSLVDAAFDWFNGINFNNISLNV